MDMSIENISSAPYLCSEEGLALIRETTEAVHVALQKIKNLKQYVKHQMTLKSTNSICSERSSLKRNALPSRGPKIKNIVKCVRNEYLQSDVLINEEIGRSSDKRDSLFKLQEGNKNSLENTNQNCFLSEINDKRTEFSDHFNFSRIYENSEDKDPQMFKENNINNTSNKSDLSNSFQSTAESPLGSARLSVKPIESLLNVDSLNSKKWRENFEEKIVSPFGNMVPNQTRETKFSMPDFNEKIYNRFEIGLGNTSKENLTCNITHYSDFNNSYQSTSNSPTINLENNFKQDGNMVNSHSDFHYLSGENPNANSESYTSDISRQNIIDGTGWLSNTGENCETSTINSSHCSLVGKQSGSYNLNKNGSLSVQNVSAHEKDILELTSLEKQSIKAISHQVHFIVEHNRVSGRDIKEAFMKEGIDDFTVDLKRGEFYSTGFMEFPNEELAKRATELSSSILVLGRNLKVLPQEKNPENNQPIPKISSTEELIFPIEECELINVSCVPERNKEMGLEPLLSLPEKSDISEERSTYANEQSCHKKNRYSSYTSSRDSSDSNITDFHKINNYTNRRHFYCTPRNLTEYKHRNQYRNNFKSNKSFIDSMHKNNSQEGRKNAVNKISKCEMNKMNRNKYFRNMKVNKNTRNNRQWGDVNNKHPY